MVENRERLTVLASAGIQVGTGGANILAPSRSIGCKIDEVGGRLRMELRSLKRLKAGGRPQRFVIEVEPLQANQLRDRGDADPRRRRARRRSAARRRVRADPPRGSPPGRRACRERERRLASLGEMSAVLAHEIKNPLASLKGNAQLLARMLPGGGKAARQGRPRRRRGDAARAADQRPAAVSSAPGRSPGPRSTRPASCATPPRRCAAKLDPTAEDSQLIGLGRATIAVEAAAPPHGGHSTPGGSARS